MEALVRLRGDVNVDGDVRDTLAMLNLHRVNHATLVPDEPTYRGMVTKVNDVVAHGEPTAETVAVLLESRGEPAEGDADVDDAWVADNTAHEDVAGLADALVAEETTLADAGLSPVLRLHPPRGGHDGVKTPASDGGQLGSHTTDQIDALLESMR